MHDIYRALDVIKTSLDLPALELNQDGQAELAFTEGLVAHITRVGEEALEFSFRLPALDYATPAMMRAMLGANLLGAATDGGRLALDLDKDEAVYCERWIVTDMGEAAIQRRLLAFMDTGVYWLTRGADALVDGTRDIGSAPVFGRAAAGQGDEPPPPTEAAFMLRI